VICRLFFRRLDANFAIDVQGLVGRFWKYKTAVLHPQSSVVWITLPGGWAKAAPPYCLLHDNIDELVGHDDHLNDLLTVQERPDFGVPHGVFF